MDRGIREKITYCESVEKSAFSKTYGCKSLGGLCAFKRLSTNESRLDLAWNTGADCETGVSVFTSPLEGSEHAFENTRWTTPKIQTQDILFSILRDFRGGDICEFRRFFRHLVKKIFKNLFPLGDGRHQPAKTFSKTRFPDCKSLITGRRTCQNYG